MDVETVYREVAPKLASYLEGNGLSHAEACDIVQETFLRLWKRRDELSDDPHQVSGLAFAIARNCRNDLYRKDRRLVGLPTSGTDDAEVELPAAETEDVRRPGEEAEEVAALRRRLQSALGRMPVELLETFALSRLGNLAVRDIASGTGASEANVKVRVHRAKVMLEDLLRADPASADGSGAESRPAAPGFAVLKAMMMLAAVDGEIAREELVQYRVCAETFVGGGKEAFAEAWRDSVRAMAYVGFLSEILPPEELVGEFVREVAAAFAAGSVGPDDGRRLLSAVKRMAAADGDCSRVERACIEALTRRLKVEG